VEEALQPPPTPNVIKLRGRRLFAGGEAESVRLSLRCGFESVFVSVSLPKTGEGSGGVDVEEPGIQVNAAGPALR